MNLSGTSFNKVDIGLVRGDLVVIHRETSNKFDNDSQPAYAVYYEGLRIGYIPAIETVKRKMIEAKRAGNNKDWAYHNERVNELIYLRDCIYTDIERNHITPVGTIYNYFWIDDEAGMNDKGIGNPSITIDMDYQ